MGKGSNTRPIIDRTTFEDSWDHIFGPKEPSEFQTGIRVIPPDLPPSNGSTKY
jgi:hypothetical protein